jgi:DNA invertase Pin-like site-specific DNA recombinase
LSASAVKSEQEIRNHAKEGRRLDANSKAEQRQAAKAQKRIKFSRTAPEGLQLIPQKEQISFYLDTGERVIAIYVRVSTDSINQISSFEMQQSYYTEMVERHEGGKLYKIYGDEGLSGTTTKKREAFNQMIADCEAGLIDTIVTKSVSRFSRNIMDAIGTARRLAKLRPPVGVYFENEGLYTLAGDGEFRLTNSSSVAQEESRIKSVAMNSSIEMRFSRGIFLTPPLLGYDNDEDGGLIVNEEEGHTVSRQEYQLRW